MSSTPKSDLNADQIEFVEQIRAMLRPLLQPKTLEASVSHLIETLEPVFKKAPVDLDTLLLFQLATMQEVTPQNKGDTRAFLTEALKRINTFGAKAKLLEHSLSQAIGQNRYAQIPSRAPLHNLGQTMMDDEPWSFVIGEDLIEVQEDVEELLQLGVVSSIHITFPNGAKYGVPSVATEEGARDWLWEQGFSVIEDLSVVAEDTGDSTMMACELEIYLPDSAMQQIIESAKHPSPQCATYRNS